MPIRSFTALLTDTRPRTLACDDTPTAAPAFIDPSKANIKTRRQRRGFLTDILSVDELGVRCERKCEKQDVHLLTSPCATQVKSCYFVSANRTQCSYWRICRPLWYRSRQHSLGQAFQHRPLATLQSGRKEKSSRGITVSSTMMKANSISTWSIEIDLAQPSQATKHSSLAGNVWRGAYQTSLHSSSGSRAQVHMYMYA